MLNQYSQSFARQICDDFFAKNNTATGAQLLQLTYIPAPYSIFKDTYKLTPGHFMTIDLTTKKIDIEKYWDVYDGYAKPALNISEQEAKDESLRLLKSACEYRMVADVPVGIFLSGGYDSGLTTALLQSTRTEKLKTFTIGYENKTFNETEEAKAVAQHLGTDHTEYICETREAVNILTELPFFYDEPLGDTSIIPTTLVSQLARKSVTVALSADGGDETFAGYTRYEYIVKQQNYLKYIPDAIGNASANVLSWFNPQKIPFLNKAYNINSRYDKVINLLKNRSTDNAYKQFLSYFLERDVKQLIQQPFTFPPTVIDTLPPNGHMVLIYFQAISNAITTHVCSTSWRVSGSLVTYAERPTADDPLPGQMRLAVKHS